MSSGFVVHPRTGTPVDRSVRLIQAENHILELIAKGTPLAACLREIALTAERFSSDGVLCSILLLDESRTTLLHGAAPSIAETYNQAIHGVKIGPEVGSCGTAAYQKQPVIVRDVDTDPKWASFKDLALSHGLHACWSTPILTHAGDILGTFAMYYRVPMEPSGHDHEVVDLLSKTAALAIQRDASEKRQQVFQEQIRALNRTGMSLAAEHDLKTIVQTATDAATKVSRAAFGAFFYNVINQAGESYTLYTVSGVPEEAFSRFPMPRNTKVFAPTFSGSHIVRVDDITQDPRYGKNAPYHGMPQGHLPVRSYLAVPVISRSGEVLGGLFLGHPEPGVFREEAEELVTSIASQSAIAIDNARLHEAMQHQIARFQEMERRLVTAQQAAQFATWECDFASGELTFNPGGADLFPQPLAEIRNVQTWLANVVEADRRRLQEGYESARERGVDLTVEYRVPSPNGGVRWIYSRGHVITDAGRPLKLLGSSLDITDRKQAEETARSKEQQFRTLAESIPQLAWMANPDGWIFWYNRRWYEYTGTTEKDMEGWGWQSVHHPEVLPSVLQRWRQSIATGAPFDMVFPLRGADGRFRPFLTRVMPVRDASGELVRWVGTNTDILAQQEKEDALRASQQRLQAALSASNTGTYRWDPASGEFLEMDDHFKNLFGFDSQSANPRLQEFMDRIHPEDRSAVQEGVERLKRGLEFDMEYRVVLPDGNLRWILSRARMEWKDGQPDYVVGACTDITARKLAHHALIQSEKLASAGRLAATVAHEINNPLEAVTNFIYLAKTDEELPERVRQYLDYADLELSRVTHIAQQTLGFYRDNSQPAWFAVAPVVREVEKIYQRKLESRGLTLEVQVDEGLRIYMLQGEFKQVLSNLLANSIDATRAGGRIVIRAREATDWRRSQPGFRIVVADTGSGIPADLKRNLFAPFFTTKRDVGTGLGLWVTRSLVEKHGGRIALNSSTGPKHGTVMSIFLPRARA